MQGFLVFDYVPRYEEAIARLADWMRSSALGYREDILDGIEHAPGAIAGLYRGENLGKRLIRLSEYLGLALVARLRASPVTGRPCLRLIKCT